MWSLRSPLSPEPSATDNREIRGNFWYISGPRTFDRRDFRPCGAGGREGCKQDQRPATALACLHACSQKHASGQLKPRPGSSPEAPRNRRVEPTRNQPGSARKHSAEAAGTPRRKRGRTKPEARLRIHRKHAFSFCMHGMSSCGLRFWLSAEWPAMREVGLKLGRPAAYRRRGAPL